MTILQDVPDCNVYKFNNNDTKVSRDQTLKFSAPFDMKKTFGRLKIFTLQNKTLKPLQATKWILISIYETLH